MTKTWFITGSSKGFGKNFARAALGRGDQVAATARNTDALDDLVDEFGELVLPLTLDVTDRDQIAAAVAEATAHFGRLDVVVNNAGYGLFGAAEEITEQQLRDQMEVNFFGLVAVTQEVLPVLREQGAGHIVQISTIGGVAAFPNLSGYHASKWAVEGFSESMAQEVAEFGIHVTIVEPGGYATDWMGPSATFAAPNPAYDGLREAQRARSEDRSFKMGQPAGVGPAILKVVDAEQPPLRVLFGEMGLGLVKHTYATRLQTWEEHNDVALLAQGN